MARFFIDRPVFAWVVALFILLGGALSIPNLPVAQYPVIAPPAIALSTSYPGASVTDLYTGTTRLIEDELNWDVIGAHLGRVVDRAVARS